MFGVWLSPEESDSAPGLVRQRIKFMRQSSEASVLFRVKIVGYGVFPLVLALKVIWTTGRCQNSWCVESPSLSALKVVRAARRGQICGAGRCVLERATVGSATPRTLVSMTASWMTPMRLLRPCTEESYPCSALRHVALWFSLMVGPFTGAGPWGSCPQGHGPHN